MGHLSQAFTHNAVMEYAIVTLLSITVKFLLTCAIKCCIVLYYRLYFAFDVYHFLTPNINLSNQLHSTPFIKFSNIHFDTFRAKKLLSLAIYDFITRHFHGHGPGLVEIETLVSHIFINLFDELKHIACINHQNKPVVH